MTIGVALKKPLLTTLFWLMSSVSCYASTWHDIQSEIGEDKFAHAGMSYIVCDQLKRNAGFNDFWAAATTLAIGAAKEKWIDRQWDNGDFAADCAGVLFYQIKF